MNGGTILQIVIFAALCAGGLPADEIGIRAPEGFEVTLYADDDLAHDINSMTIDSQGRVVVAGQGYVKILHDTDDDGRADKATLFSEFPKSGAHGMVFLGNDLIATGDNMLMRLKDENADGIADGRPLPLAIVRSPEHGANGLVQGPDGWIYMIGGNDAGIGAQLARTDSSPVKKPQSGAVVRFSPDFKTSEVFAHGFRNPYDLVFNENGHLFTVDADGERDQYLPWYTPTRLFDIQQGMHHGWVQRGWTRSWNRPECFFDNVERLVEIGRGSPTGVECYRHYAFPSHYRGGIYSCCWTLGTVYYFPLKRDGASYKSEKEIFLQTTGDVGFAPVDLAVGPEGDMFIAIGGRGTRGSVFRVRYVGGLDKEELHVAKEGLVGILNAPQPLSAWSRAKWMPLAKEMAEKHFEHAAVGDLHTTYERGRALEILTELHGGLSADAFGRLTWDNAWIEGRAAWSAGHNSDSDDFIEEVVYRTNPSEGDEMTSRAAWETLAKFPPERLWFAATRWRGSMRDPRRIQAAALQVAGDPGVDPKHTKLADVKSSSRKMAILQYRAMHSLLGPEDFGDVLPLLDVPSNLLAAVEDEGESFVYLLDEEEQEEETPPPDDPFSPERIPTLRDGVEPPSSLQEFLSRDDWFAPAREPRTATLRRDLDPPVTLREFREQGKLAQRLPLDDVDIFFPQAEPRVAAYLDEEEEDDARRRVAWRLDVIRMFQLCVGDIRVTAMQPDVYAGYTANAADKVDEEDRRLAAEKLAKMFPTRDADTNREIARTIGMLELEGEAVETFAEKLTGCWNLRSSIQDDIHYLIVLSRLPGERSEAMTEATAATLAFLHMKLLIDDMYPSRNWPTRVGETFVELCKRDPKLAETLAAHRDFGMASHAMFARQMPEKQRKLATRRMFQKAKARGEGVAWTAEMVALFAELGDDKADAAIRDQWHNFGLRDAIILARYRKPQPEDRKLFVEALRETNASTVARAAQALAGIGQEGSREEIAAALAALRHYSADKDARETRQAIGESLKIFANQKFSFPEESKDDALAAYKPAFDWFSKSHPEEAAKLNRLADPDGVDWSARLSKIDFTQGEPARGAKLYESRSCAKCHSGRNRLGPALEGVTGRWARADLIKEIVDPNRTVAPQFLTSRLETKNGKVYQGMPIYQSPDGTLLQTGPNETIRIAGPEVVSISKSRTSLMPTGLIRDVSDQDVADLYAYLKTLVVRPQ